MFPLGLIEMCFLLLIVWECFVPFHNSLLVALCKFLGLLSSLENLHSEMVSGTLPFSSDLHVNQPPGGERVPGSCAYGWLRTTTWK